MFADLAYFLYVILVEEITLFYTSTPRISCHPEGNSPAEIAKGLEFIEHVMRKSPRKLGKMA
jgi:hypothetical protein